MYQLLDGINSPDDIKSLSEAELVDLCQEIRDYIIECCSHNPGHLGSSLGAVEIAVAVHKVFDAPKDKIVWDVGHQAYAHKILTGRREDFLHNRERGSLSGFPKRSESEYDAFGAGHASTSISAALGMAVADRMQGCSAHHIAIIGDGAMTGGLAFEGLNNAGSIDNDMLVILNDNRISIDMATGALHKHLIKVTTSHGYNRFKKNVWELLGEGRFRDFTSALVSTVKKFILHDSSDVSMFDALGFRYFGPIDGNNLHEMISTLDRLKTIPGPKLLHVITTKGKGYKPAEDNPCVWHAPGSFDPETGRLLKSSQGADRYQVVFGETVTELARSDNRIVSVTPAMLRGSSLNIMQKEMPERVFDVGIAEGHAVTFSAGLAASGMLPVCNIYSTFMQRAYDNVIHDVALQKLKVIFCLDRAGLVGEDGATHQGVFDLPAFRSVPNLAIASPCNEIELRNLLYSAATDEYPATIIRYPRACGVGMDWRNAGFERIPLGKARLLHEGSRVAILSIGPVGNRCAEAVEEFGKKGREILHYDMRFLKPFDMEAMEDACGKAEVIITVEDGAIKGGLFGEVSEYVASHAYNIKVVPFGVPDKFIEQGSLTQQYADCGMDLKNIVEKVADFFDN